MTAPRRWRACAAALLGVVGACTHPPPLPTHAWAGPEDALRVLRARAAEVRTLQSSARLILTRPDGQTVHLDGALVAEPPGRLRLRAWKLGQAVFDLTYTADGVWLKAGRDAGERDESLPMTTAGFARAWSLFAPDFFSPPEAAMRPDDGGPILIVERRANPDAGSAAILCEVDRATLTPRRYTVLDEAGEPRSTLTLSRYRDFDGILWPTSIEAASGSGTVTVRIETARFNEDPPPAAFVPPAGAVKQP
jgi:hypothetical protein